MYRFIVALIFAASVAATAPVARPACESAGLHGLVDKTDVSDFRPEKCAVFVSHKRRAVYITPASFPRAMRLVTKEFCEGMQCHPEELTRYPVVRGTTLKEYFAFTFVKNPWMRALRARGNRTALNHAACALGRVDFVARVEHAESDWAVIVDTMRGRESVMWQPKSVAANESATGASAGCEDYPPPLEFAVNTWYSDDIEGFRFPRPADLAKTFYSGAGLK